MQFNARVDGKINTQKTQVNGNLTTNDKKLSGNIKMGGTGGAKLPIDYEKNTQLINRPQINEVEVIGNKSIEDYGVKTLSNLEIKQIFDRIFNKGGN